MAKKVPDDVKAGLGDITELMHNQGVSDLSWLSVDPDEYRRLEALPQQNLDTIPELQKALAWDGQDERVPSLVPMKPVTVVNQNPSDLSPPQVRSPVSVARRLASYVMAGLSDEAIRSRLSSEFSPQQLRAASAEALAVLEERGLLGNVYVDASHFPRCAQEGPHRQFVARHARRALYVLAKPECPGCVHNKDGMCSSLKKRVVSEVPYDRRLAAHYSVQLSAEGRLSEADVTAFATTAADSLPASGREIKERLRFAFRRPAASVRPDGVQTIRQQDRPAVPQITDADRAAFAARRAAAGASDPMPGPMYMVAARRIMLGQADPSSVVASSDPEVRSLARDHGLLGHTFLDGDALGGAGEVAKFVRSRGARPDFVLLRSAASADAADMAELSKLGLTVVPSRPAIGKEHFASACERALSEGRISREQSDAALANLPGVRGEDFPRLVAQLNLHRPGAPDPVPDVSPAPRASFHHGDPGRGLSPALMDPEEVRRTVSAMMNSGLSGRRLVSAVLGRYSRSDLSQVPQVGASLAADDGVQGSYFIDPTAYPDYGRGCSTGAESLRRRRVPHVLAGSSCTGCRYQTHPGWCSKYAKNLIRQVPDSVRAEAAERRRLPVVSDRAPVENPVEKYELSSDFVLDPRPAPRAAPDVSLPARSATE